MPDSLTADALEALLDGSPSVAIKALSQASVEGREVYVLLQRPSTRALASSGSLDPLLKELFLRLQRLLPKPNSTRSSNNYKNYDLLLKFFAQAGIVSSTLDPWLIKRARLAFAQEIGRYTFLGFISTLTSFITDSSHLVALFTAAPLDRLLYIKILQYTWNVRMRLEDFTKLKALFSPLLVPVIPPQTSMAATFGQQIDCNNLSRHMLRLAITLDDSPQSLAQLRELLREDLASGPNAQIYRVLGDLAGYIKPCPPLASALLEHFWLTIPNPGEVDPDTSANLIADIKGVLLLWQEDLLSVVFSQLSRPAQSRALIVTPIGLRPVLFSLLRSAPPSQLVSPPSPLSS